MRAFFASLTLVAMVSLMLATGPAASAIANTGAKQGSDGVAVALNPQPLPPIIDDHDFDEDFRG
jgi:hypothetical protein